jgi:hypothetical protein
MAHGHTAKQSHGFVGDHPGLIAALFAIVVTAGFLFALYSSAQGHHEAAPAAHGSAPAAAAPHH